MKNLIIIGAGGFGREVANWAIHEFEKKPGWCLVGFLDDNPYALNGKITSIPILGSISEFVSNANLYVTIALGSSLVRRRLHDQLRLKGAQFANIVHPSSIIAGGTQLGDGVIVAPFAIVSADVCVGDGVLINYHAVIQHDAKIGRWSQVGSHSNIGGGAILGEEVFVGTNSVVSQGARVPSCSVVAPGMVFTTDYPTE